MGLSFVYGRLPRAALGAAGSDSGLCVRFLTRDMQGLPAQALQVLLDGVILRDLDLEDAVDDLTKEDYRGGPATDKHVCHSWFENTRERGAEAFGNHADNLTAIVANISLGGGDDDDGDLGT